MRQLLERIEVSAHLGVRPLPRTTMITKQDPPETNLKRKQCEKAETNLKTHETNPVFQFQQKKTGKAETNYERLFQQEKLLGV